MTIGVEGFAGVAGIVDELEDELELLEDAFCADAVGGEGGDGDVGVDTMIGDCFGVGFGVMSTDLLLRIGSAGGAGGAGGDGG